VTCTPFPVLTAPSSLLCTVLPPLNCPPSTILTSYCTLLLLPPTAPSSYILPPLHPPTSPPPSCTHTHTHTPTPLPAKVAYHDILANVDVLHGVAESFLSITNFLIISGFRNTRPKDPSSPSSLASTFTDSALLLVPTVLILYNFMQSGALHPEPTNALSIPTWIVHSSSLLEW
jgi:hypothetical protein